MFGRGRKNKGGGGRGCGHQPGRALCDITKLPHFLVCVLPGGLTDRIETLVNVGGGGR